MLPSIPYDRAAAIAYAHEWAFGRNPDYYNYDDIGGDCTNFSSQCLFAGTGVMNFTPDYGWYYIDANRKAPAWTGVPYFNQFMTRLPPPGPGPIMELSDLEHVIPGDFLQLKFVEERFSHTVIIVEMGNPPTLENTLIAAHSYDADFYPISEYYAKEHRFLHVLGAFPPRKHNSRPKSV
ncbi:MAG: amidase domain-containing protein [Oscillospiraceae bacterium]